MRSTSQCRFCIFCVLVLVLSVWGAGPVSGSLLITEFMALNDNTLEIAGETTPDWIELYNSGSQTIDTQGYYLTDDPDELDKWTLPEMTLEPGAYLLVYATGLSDIIAGNVHTSFKLSSKGEYLALVAPDGRTILHDYAPAYPRQFADISYGIGQDVREGRYFPHPTPGMQNGIGVQYVVEDVHMSLDHGFYEYDPRTPLILTLDCPTDQVEIYYTINGSEPNLHDENSTHYTHPIELTTTTCVRAKAFRANALDGRTVTRTYIFLDDVIRQSESPAGFPTSWSGGNGGGRVNYDMDQVIVNEYAADIKGALLDIPTLSIVTKLENLWDPDTGIYNNSIERGEAWERPCSVELIYPDGQEGFQIDCGIRSAGKGSRHPANNNKHSWKLKFKSEYGSSKLRFPLFPESPVDHFDTLILRGTSNYSWIHFGGGGLAETRNKALYVRDLWAKDVQLAMGHPASRGIYVHLYFNGLYWGLYNPCERPDADFLADHIGGESEEWDVRKAGGIVVDGEVDENGDNPAWEDAVNLARAGLEDPVAYEQFQEIFDVNNLIDYLMIEHFSANLDWGDWEGGNWYAGRRRTPGSPGSKWIAFAWDTEYSMGDLHKDRTEAAAGFTVFYNALRKNREFRMLYADRIQKNLFNQGCLSAETASDIFLNRAAQIELAIICESARWGDNHIHAGYPRYTKNEFWLPALDWVINEFIRKRPPVLLEQYRKLDLYPPLEAPVFLVNGQAQHGGLIQPFDTISVTDTVEGNGTEGHIYYTLDGTDPRVPGDPGLPASSAIEIANPAYPAEAPLNNTIVFIRKGDTFRYLDNGMDQGTTWRTNHFKDIHWQSGRAEFGYGDGDEATVVSYGPQSSNKYITTYFRKNFHVGDLSQITDLTLELKRDDGAVVYMNGTEIARSGFDSSTSVQYTTLAHNASSENSFIPFTLDKSVLLENSLNTIAIEIHQASRTSSDISFDMELYGRDDSQTVPVDPIQGDIPITETTHIKARTFDGANWSALSEAVFTVE